MIEPVIGTIAIDAGHGGKDPGAISYIAGKNESSKIPYKWIFEGTKTDLCEADLNYVMAGKIAKNLVETHKIPVVVIRPTRSCFLTPYSRLSLFQNSCAKMLLSVHMNSYSGFATGFEVLVGKYSESKTFLLANKVASAIRKCLPNQFPFRGIKIRPDLTLLSTLNPSIIIEPGFLTDLDFVEWIIKEENQDELSLEIAGALADEFFNRPA